MNLIQNDTFVFFGAAKQNEISTINMSDETSQIFDLVKDNYASEHKQVSEQISEQLNNYLIKNLKYDNKVKLKFKTEKLLDISLESGKSGNEISLTKSDDNKNAYQLTFKDEKNKTQKIILASQ